MVDVKLCWQVAPVHKSSRSLNGYCIIAYNFPLNIYIVIKWQYKVNYIYYGHIENINSIYKPFLMCITLIDSSWNGKVKNKNRYGSVWFVFRLQTITVSIKELRFHPHCHKINTINKMLLCEYEYRRCGVRLCLSLCNEW